MELKHSGMKETLDQLLENAELFANTLDIEKNAIQKIDADLLLKIAQQKKELSTKITSLDKTLETYADALRNDNNLSLNQYLSNHSDHSLASSWNAVKDIMRRCLESNKHNEHLLNNSIGHASQALNLLVTTATGEPCSTYNKAGHKSNISSDVVLAKA